MTVSNTTARKTAAGNGTTTAFPTTFEFDTEETLVVTQVVDATGIETVKTLTTDYTVTGGGGASGTVNMIVAPPTDETLVIERVEPYNQGTDYLRNDPFNSQTAETAYDKLTFLVQQVLDFTQRAIKLKKTTALTDVVIPDPEVGKFIRGKTTTEYENADITSSGEIGIPVSIADGGTGAITAVAARASLGVAGAHRRETASYLAVAADRAKMIEFDSASAVTLDLTAAATLGSEWLLYVHNSGAGTLTVDPNASEKIDDVTTFDVEQDQSLIIFCDGTGFWTVGRSTGWELIGTATASASATVDFTWAGKTYKRVILIANAVQPTTDDVEAWLRTSGDGGSTFAEGASDYEWYIAAHQGGGGTDVSDGDSGDPTIKMTIIAVGDAVGNASNEGWSGVIEIIHPAEATYTTVLYRGFYEDSGGTSYTLTGSGRRYAATDTDGIRFMFETDTIASGEFACLGQR